MSIFDSNPKYQSLSPEAKSAVEQKYAALSPEAQQIVAQKLSAPQPGIVSRTVDAMTPQLVKTGIAALHAADLPASGQDIMQRGLSQAGEAIAGSPSVNKVLNNPLISSGGKGTAVQAGVGTAVDQAGNLALGSEALANAPEMAAAVSNFLKQNPLSKTARAVFDAFHGPSLEEAKTGAAELRHGFVPAASQQAEAKGQAAIRAAQDAVEQQKLAAAQAAAKVQNQVAPKVAAAQAAGNESLVPLRGKIAGIQQNLKVGLPEQVRQETAAAEAAKKAAGKQMGEAEVSGGFPSNARLDMKTARRMGDTSVPGVALTPRDIAARVAPTFDQGAQAAAKTYSPQTLQAIRKVFDNASNASEATTKAAPAIFGQYGSTAGEALGEIHKPFKVAREGFIAAANKLDALPQDFAARKQALQGSLIQAGQALDKASTSVADMVRGVRASETMAAQSATKTQRLATQKAMLSARAELTAAKRAAQDLLSQAKAADAAKLAEIEQQARDLIQQGTRNSKTMRNVKAGAVVAAGAAGAGGFLRLMVGHGVDRMGGSGGE